MSENQREDIVSLIATAKKELEKAVGLLSALQYPADKDVIKVGLDAIENYISHADDIVAWLRNATEEN